MTERTHGESYEIRVEGRLSPSWSAWFDAVSVEADGDGTTTIRSRPADQAALHGLLLKLRDLGIPIVALTAIPARPTTGRTTHTTDKEH